MMRNGRQIVGAFSQKKRLPLSLVTVLNGKCHFKRHVHTMEGNHDGFRPGGQADGH